LWLIVVSRIHAADEIRSYLMLIVF